MVLFTPSLVLFFVSRSHICSSLLSSVITPSTPFSSLAACWTQGAGRGGEGESDASVAVCAASAARQGVGGVVQLGGGEGGGRGVGGRGGESTGLAGQSQLPQGIQGIHLGSP